MAIMQNQIEGKNGHESLEEELAAMTITIEKLEKDNQTLKEEIKKLSAKDDGNVKVGTKQW